MNSFNLVKEDIINFKRMTDLNVTAYEIIVHETLPSGTVIKYILDTIPNPRYMIANQHVDTLKYRVSKIWDLSKDILTDIEFKVEVIVNGTKLKANEYHFSKALFTLTILKDLKETDEINVSYFKDEIVYRHSTLSNYKYSVNPVIDYTLSMGNHNILK